MLFETGREKGCVCVSVCLTVTLIRITETISVGEQETCRQCRATFTGR